MYPTRTTSLPSIAGDVVNVTVEPLVLTPMIVTGVPFTVIAKDEASAVFAFSASLNVSTAESPVESTAELTSLGP